MRLYHFLPEQYALDDLVKGRLKLSQLDNLNDPFELWCQKQSDRRMRQALRAWKQQMSSAYGLLCFCANWRNPLLWSHYADRHRGICLGFDVRDDCVARVNYIEKRTPISLPITEHTMMRVLFTKFSGWSYEEEWRAWLRLEDSDPIFPNHYFRKFDKDIKLQEVIAGPLCGVEKPTLSKAIRAYSPRPRLIKARLAFESFNVVENKLGFMSKA